MWLGDMYWNPARPPREAVSIDILHSRPMVGTMLDMGCEAAVNWVLGHN